MVEQVELKRGLKDVYIDTTESSFIDGTVGKLIYRGYNIHDLAEKSTFEETTFLLIYGKLPTRAELDQLDSQLRTNREIPQEITQVIRIVKKAHPMDVLRTGVSALAAFDPETENNALEVTLRKGIRLTAQVPTIAAAHARIRQGKEPIKPNPDLNHAGNFLYMLTGKVPSEDEIHLMDKDFILHAEHGINASSFAARVAASTQADVHCSVVSGIATLKGPWHGGAAEAIGKMGNEIGDESNVPEYIQQKLASGERIMGFGHRVYKTEDPRAQHLREGARMLGEKKGQPKWFRILSRVEEEMHPYAAKGICVNVDFWSGAIYTLLEIPEDLFISIFALGRVPGWVVQVLEQQKDNILLRPRLQYVGPMDMEYVPIDQRR